MTLGDLSSGDMTTPSDRAVRAVDTPAAVDAMGLARANCDAVRRGVPLGDVSDCAMVAAARNAAVSAASARARRTKKTVSATAAMTTTPPTTPPTMAPIGVGAAADGALGGDGVGGAMSEAHGAPEQGAPFTAACTLCTRALALPAAVNVDDKSVLRLEDESKVTPTN